MADAGPVSFAANPIAQPAQWDAVQIGTLTSPGYCELAGFARNYEWDVKAGKGTNGATITYTQNPPAEGSITFFLWDDGTLGTGHNHFSEWSLFVPHLKYDPTKKTVQAIQIYHPVLAANDITAVVCKSIGPMVVDKGSLMASVQVEFIEYWPPPKTSAVGTASSSSAPHKIGKADSGTPNSGDQPAAQDADQQEIGDLWNELNS